MQFYFQQIFEFIVLKGGQETILKFEARNSKYETNYDCVHHTIPFGSFACSVMQIYLGQNLSNDRSTNVRNRRKTAFSFQP